MTKTSAFGTHFWGSIGLYVAYVLNMRYTQNCSRFSCFLTVFLLYRNTPPANLQQVIIIRFYNLVICSIIVYGSVCWDGNISKFDRGRLEKIVKKKKKAGHVVGMPMYSFKTLYEKQLVKKLMQILNDPTHPMRHHFDSRRRNRSGRFLLLKTNTNCYKAVSYTHLRAHET